MGDKTNFEGCVGHGPWGGSEGKSWIYMPKGFIKKIVIEHGYFVDGIKFFSASSSSNTGEIESSHIGGKDGNETDEIIIDYPHEYLRSITGTLNRYDGSVIVGSLRFATNFVNYGPYGSDLFGTTSFSYSGKGEMIVGFHGRVSQYLQNAHGGFSQFLEAIGIYAMPRSLAFWLNFTPADDSMRELCSIMPRIAMPRDAGPWGAFGGRPWDDGVFSGVKKVIVYGGVSLNAICAIQLEYVKRDAESFLSPMHGGSGGDTMELLSAVDLDGVDEYLSGISGFYGPIKGYDGLMEAITSITFHTNKTKYGPYGEKSGAGFTCFSSMASCGKVVGFHGRNDGILSAIGVHMEYI